MSRNTRIMCWNIDRERRKCGPDAAGVRRFIPLADVALSKSMESSKAGIKSSQNGRTYRTDDGCYEFGKHQTRGERERERWLNGNHKDHTFMRGNGVTGISPGWSRRAPQDIYDVRVNKSFVSTCIFLCIYNARYVTFIIIYRILSKIKRETSLQKYLRDYLILKIKIYKLYLSRYKWKLDKWLWYFISL